jgi:uncharacterized protein
MLEQLQGRRPEFVGVVLGNGRREKFRTDDYFYYYRAVKNAFLAQQKGFGRETHPLLSGMADHGRWNGHVDRLLAVRDDLSLVANIRTSQIQRLKAGDVITLSDLAASAITAVRGIAPNVFDRLRRQARCQRDSPGKAVPEYECVEFDPERPTLGFGRLPPPSPLDICFDIEGYPLVEGGLEYLLGVVFEEDGEMRFRDWWGHDGAGEKTSFESFVHWAYARWQADPAMHIYHYADYETSALKRLMCRYAVCESEIDDLLRNNVFVDLYAVVRQALIVGEVSYSLKNIEHLYMTERGSDVKTAGDSIVWYHRWRELPDGENWQTSATLRQIRDYNEADCISTCRLIVWLRQVQHATGIAYVPPPAEEARQPGPATTNRALVAQQMLAEIPAAAATDQLERWRVHALLAYLLEFHRREDKPSRWLLYKRLGMTEQQLFEEPDCIAEVCRTSRPPEAVRKSLRYEYAFDPEQESKLRSGSKCVCWHDPLLRIEIDEIDYQEGRLYFTLGKSRPSPPAHLSLIPDDMVPAKPIVESIGRTVTEYRRSGTLPAALQTLVRRYPPTLRDHSGGTVLDAAEDLIFSLKDVVSRMEATTLVIQGPPGCGKTSSGGKVIASLLKVGKRVGVTSNGHRAIALLLKEAAQEAGKMGVVFTGAKAGCDEDEPPIHPAVEMLPENGDLFALPAMPDLVGGTAWVFSRPEAAGQFDYLFVDEASQVSLANVVGMSPAASNLVLMGDQMQLNQPIQGTHPGESGSSALTYLLGDERTIRPERGIFLPSTWRMRKEVCRFISDSFYEGRLHSDPGTQAREILADAVFGQRMNRTSGIVYVPCEHDGSTYQCLAEASLIRDLVQELCRQTLILPGEAPRKLGLEDILVVVPYNLQVRTIQAVIPGVRVGTVDKFQGQQAPVVIYGMTSSEGDASPRGIEFLFSGNRLNVAISRAQILAILVASPKLVRTRCSSIERMKLLNLFCRAVEAGAGEISVPAV